MSDRPARIKHGASLTTVLHSSECHWRRFEFQALFISCKFLFETSFISGAWAAECSWDVTRDLQIPIDCLCSQIEEVVMCYGWTVRLVVFLKRGADSVESVLSQHFNVLRKAPSLRGRR